MFLFFVLSWPWCLLIKGEKKWHQLVFNVLPSRILYPFPGFGWFTRRWWLRNCFLAWDQSVCESSNSVWMCSCFFNHCIGWQVYKPNLLDRLIMDVLYNKSWCLLRESLLSFLFQVGCFKVATIFSKENNHFQNLQKVLKINGHGIGFGISTWSCVFPK